MLRHANRPLPLPFPAPQVEAVSPAAAAGSGKWVGESQAAELTAHRLDADAVLLRTTVFGPGTSGRVVDLGACRALRLPPRATGQCDEQQPACFRSLRRIHCIVAGLTHSQNAICRFKLRLTRLPLPLPCHSGRAGVLARGPRRHHCGHLLQPPEQGAHLEQRVSLPAAANGHRAACHSAGSCGFELAVPTFAWLCFIRLQSKPHVPCPHML